PWVSDGGTSQVTESPDYLWITTRPLAAVGEARQPAERLPGGRVVKLCQSRRVYTDPFDLTAASGECTAWSKVNNYGPPSAGNGTGTATFSVGWSLPVLIA